MVHELGGVRRGSEETDDDFVGGYGELRTGVDGWA
jgi:hypothetical protein